MSESRKPVSHPAQKRYPPELRERATRMVLEIFETGERHGVIGRVARQFGGGDRDAAELGEPGGDRQSAQPDR